MQIHLRISFLCSHDGDGRDYTCVNVWMRYSSLNAALSNANELRNWHNWTITILLKSHIIPRALWTSAHISSGFAFKSTFVVVGWLQCNSIERCNYAASSCNRSILWRLQPAHFMRLHHVQARTGSALLAQLQDDWTDSPTSNSNSIALWCVISFDIC